jgi:hypothetical protein
MPSLPAEVTRIGEVVPGEGIEWQNAPPGADAWRGYLH